MPKAADQSELSSSFVIHTTSSLVRIRNARIENPRTGRLGSAGQAKALASLHVLHLRWLWRGRAMNCAQRLKLPVIDATPTSSPSSHNVQPQPASSTFHTISISHISATQSNKRLRSPPAAVRLEIAFSTFDNPFRPRHHELSRPPAPQLATHCPCHRPLFLASR